MSTHVNHTVIIPEFDKKHFTVAIARGVANSGDSRLITHDIIATGLVIKEAIVTAAGARYISALDFYAYKEL